MWKVDKQTLEGSWVCIEYEMFVVLVPATDVRAHDLSSMTCSCNAKVEALENYEKPVYSHNRHSDNDLVNDAMKRIGLGDAP